MKKYFLQVKKITMINTGGFKIDDIVLVSIILLLVFLLFYKHWKTETGSNSYERKLGVADLIEEVKNDLETLDRKRQDNDEAALFTVESFDLEINFIVKESQSAEAKGEYKVVTVGGTNDVSAEKIQKIVLHLKAESKEGKVAVEPDVEDK